jgi:GT2 family glycosyltransferase
LSDISIIIVNWNSKEFVINCLAALYRRPSNLTFQVIVVDSASFDGCQQALAERFPSVTYLQLESNVGFGRANNEGFKHVTSDIVWLLNPDTEIVDDAPQILLTVLNGHKDVGLVGARLLNTDGTLQTTCVQALPTALNQAFDSEGLRRRFQIWGMQAFQSEKDPVDVEAVSGACMMLRSSHFKEIGGFDPNYFMYCEDMDLCYSLKSKGLRILYVPDAKVYHHGGRSSEKQVSKFGVVMTREALITYFRKNFGLLTAAFYRFLMGLSAVIRIVVLSMLNLIPSPTSKERSASLRKWVIILSWCVGRERWARTFSRA